MIINHVTLNMLIENARSHVELLHEHEDDEFAGNDIRYITDMLHGDLDAMTELLARASIETPKSSSAPSSHSEPQTASAP
jgi:hypothetical protein